MIYTVEQVLAQRHNYNIRDIPNQMRNFHAFLSKSPQLADQKGLQLTQTGTDDDVIKISGQSIGHDTVDFGKILSILNRLTVQNYNSLVVDLKRKAQRSLFDDARVVELLIENIKFSDSFISLYSALVQDLDKEEGTTRFSRAVGDKTLKAFYQFQTVEARQQLTDSLDVVSDPDVKMEIEGRSKRQNLAVVLFLGHLYRRNLLDHKSMYDVLRTLCVEREIGKVDEYNLDFLLSTMPTVAERLATQDPRTAQRVKHHLHSLTGSDDIPKRLKFKIQDFFSGKGGR